MLYEPTQEQRLMDAGKYLAVLSSWEKKIQSAPPAQKEYLRQMAAQASILCGDEEKALEIASAEPGSTAPKIAPPEQLRGARLRDARDEILKRAARYQVVVINEAHVTTRHRAFGASLLQGLRRLGFTYFAAETFADPKTLQSSLARRVVTRKTGAYTEEPVFAAYVQTALDLGFTPIAYESELSDESGSTVDRINARETAQANNLYERVFKANPRAKAVIHVGLSHATRTPDAFEDEGKQVELLWMAGRLTRLLGFPLLTIDQTGGTEVGAPAQESSFLRGILGLSDLKRPSLVQKSDGSFLKAGIGKDCDITVFHPRLRLRKGRPEWLFDLPGRREAQLPDSIVAPQKGRLLVQAFAEGAPEDAVDKDRFILTANTPRPVLVLPRGRYRLVIQDEDGNISDGGKLTV